MPTPSALLQNRAALVTGASRGIGRAIANLLAENGALVAVHCGTDTDAAEKVRKELKGNGHITLKADLEVAKEASSLPKQAAEGLGHLDIVVNNAGIYDTHNISYLNEKDWLSIWDRNISGRSCWRRYPEPKSLEQNGPGR